MLGTYSALPKQGPEGSTGLNLSNTCCKIRKPRRARKDIRGCGRPPCSNRGCKPMQFDPKLLERLRLGMSGDKRHVVIRSSEKPDVLAEYSFGIEEEYFLADAGTLEVAVQTPNEMFEAANWSTGGQAMREML